MNCQKDGKSNCLLTSLSFLTSLFPIIPFSICDSAEQVVKALLGLPLAQLSDKELTRRPNAMAVETLQKVCKVQGGHRSILKIVNFQVG